jgi:hypothetical protein
MMERLASAKGDSMQLLHTLETTIRGWIINVPHLPDAARTWLGSNAWWIAAIVVIINGITLLFGLFRLFTLMALMESVSSVYYVDNTAYAAWGIVTGLISFVISVLALVLTALSITPLQEKQKKGWVLLFAAWLVNIAGSMIGAILSFNPFTFILSLLFTAVLAAIAGYFLFEIHDQFAHEAKIVKKTTKKSSKK